MTHVNRLITPVAVRVAATLRVAAVIA